MWGFSSFPIEVRAELQLWREIPGTASGRIRCGNEIAAGPAEPAMIGIEGGGVRGG